MRVSHVAYSDAPGGAAKAAHRLHSSFNGTVVNSTMFVNKKYTTDESVFQYEAPNDFILSVNRILRKVQLKMFKMPYRNTRPKKYVEPFSSDITPFHGKTLIDQLPRSDILNLHWVSKFLDFESFFSQVELPIVWTLHDMATFTGGCHYNDVCDKYLSHCGECPQLGSKKYHDPAYKSFQRRLRIFSKIPSQQLHIVGLSNWMADEVKNSPILSKFPISIIPNSLNLSQFKIRDRNEIRDIFGIGKEKFVVLCSAHMNTNFRKGYSILINALSKIDPNDKVWKDLIIVTMGMGKLNFNKDIHHIDLGYLSQDGLISAIYNAADIFVLPSLQDNLPNTMLESMACGTPVLGFNTGGIPDVVKHKENGIVVFEKNAKSLFEGLKYAITNREWLSNVRNKCNTLIMDKYSPEIQSKKYIELYTNILESK